MAGVATGSLPATGVDTPPARRTPNESLPQDFPPEIGALILQKAFASTEDVRSLFHLQHLSKSTSAELALVKHSVRKLHVTIQSPTVSPGFSSFVRSFPAVQHLKVTFVFDEQRKTIDAPKFVGWLNHWWESLTELTIDIQGPDVDSDACKSFEEYADKLCSINLHSIGIDRAPRTMVTSDVTELLKSLDSIWTAIRNSCIERLSIRNFHKVDYTRRTQLAALWKGPALRYLRLEGSFLSGFNEATVSMGPDWRTPGGLETLELVTNTKNRRLHPIDSFLTHQGDLKRNLDCSSRAVGGPTPELYVKLTQPLLHFSYTDTSGEAHSPLWLDFDHPWKLQTLRVRSCNPTMICVSKSVTPRRQLVNLLGPGGAARATEKTVLPDLNDLVIDTGLQASLLAPLSRAVYKLCPCLETLSAVVTPSSLDELPAALRGLRAKCPLLKRVEISVRGDDAKNGEVATSLVERVRQEHVAAGSPFELIVPDSI